MFKKIFFLFLITFIFLNFFNFALAQESTKVYFFYGSTCPHCKKARTFLEETKEKYPSVDIYAYEVYNNKANAKLLLNFLESCGEREIIRVPSIFIGKEVIIGYFDEEITGSLIEEKVKDCLENGCPDPLEEYQCKIEKETDQIISYPIIGKINLSKLSLPVLTVVLAALDGFNPCAMWVLLFLLALLINLKSRKRMLMIGGLFIFASGLVYYLLLSAWLNLFLMISYVTLTRIIIGSLALIVGIWQIRNFIKFKPGVCEVTSANPKWNQRIMEKAKGIVKPAALPATIIGIITLAFAVNLIEFFCSAGLPAIYTRILSLSNLNSFSYYLYLLLYTLIFMLDDLLIFIIAVITLSKIGFTEKYTKYSTLIGGLVILLLGLLLLFAPQLLIFA